MKMKINLRMILINIKIQYIVINVFANKLKISIYKKNHKIYNKWLKIDFKIKI